MLYNIILELLAIVKHIYYNETKSCPHVKYIIEK